MCTLDMQSSWMAITIVMDIHRQELHLAITPTVWFSLSLSYHITIIVEIIPTVSHALTRLLS